MNLSDLHSNQRTDDEHRHTSFRPRPRPPSRSPAATKMFPVRRIWCVGRNYLEHIKEMGQDEREPPFFFAKPADAIVHDGGTVPYPPLTNDLHHEVEMVVALKSRRPQHPEGQGARLRLGLWRRHRPDAPRPADRLAQHQAAVGDRQGVRRLGAVRAAASRPPRSATRTRAASGSR